MPPESDELSYSEAVIDPLQRLLVLANAGGSPSRSRLIDPGQKARAEAELAGMTPVERMLFFGEEEGGIHSSNEDLLALFPGGFAAGALTKGIGTRAAASALFAPLSEDPGDSENVSAGLNAVGAAAVAGAALNKKQAAKLLAKIEDELLPKIKKLAGKKDWASLRGTQKVLKESYGALKQVEASRTNLIKVGKIEQQLQVEAKKFGEARAALVKPVGKPAPAVSAPQIKRPVASAGSPTAPVTSPAVGAVKTLTPVEQSLLSKAVGKSTEVAGKVAGGAGGFLKRNWLTALFAGLALKEPAGELYDKLTNKKVIPQGGPDSPEAIADRAITAAQQAQSRNVPQAGEMLKGYYGAVNEIEDKYGPNAAKRLRDRLLNSSLLNIYAPRTEEDQVLQQYRSEQLKQLLPQEFAEELSGG